MSDTADVSQRVLVALRRAKARIAELEAKPRSPIAIIGMSCRFPGGATPAAFWNTLLERRDMIREIPDERLIGAWPEQVPRWAGLLDDAAGFDTAFFGVSAVEATAMDPQQRLLLELTWEALEHARQIPARLRGSKTGVFVGLTGSEYLERVERRYPEERTAYDVTGIMPSVASGRIAYVFGFHGPAVSLDTACSSSLVAIHLACQSLRADGCELAVAGGVKVVASEQYLEFVALTQGLSPDGRCKTFDSRANGFVLGEGAGLVVLKRLADAERDGDPIVAIIRGSAINQDGRSTSLTAPNVLAQESVLRDALESAGVDPRELDYIECHGTGTALGDPIEVDAIKSVFGAPRPDDAPLWLGAAKTNIGHLEAAAGVAGLIKVLLAFRHGQIPANLHLRHLNPRIKLGQTPLKLPHEAVEWRPKSGRRRIAGVSSFGMSGTNSHVVVEEPPAGGTDGETEHRADFPMPVLLSARSESALAGQARSLLRHLESHPEFDAVDLAFSLATTRTQFEQRACVVGRDLRAMLNDLAERGHLARAATLGVARTPAKIGMLFTGQGAQRLGMGKEIHARFQVFRESFDEISACFDEHLERRLIDVVFAAEDSAEAGLIDQTAYTQPALFALEVALHRLVRSWGITPAVVFGHSIGELAAAHVAGIFSLDDACRLVAARGRLMQSLPTGGAMVSIQASEPEIRALLLDADRGVDIAGFNGPLSVVISGDEGPTLAVAEQLRARGRKIKRLIVSHAFHSHRMDPMLAEFEAIARTIAFVAPEIPIVANVSGQLADPGEICEAGYWVRQVREPVRFFEGIQALERLGANVLLEIGPHGVLSAMATACVSAEMKMPTIVVPALARDDEAAALVSALGTLHCHGVAVDWPAFFAPLSPRATDLPTYAFQRGDHWIEVSEHRAASKPSSGLLGDRLASPLELAQFPALLDPRRFTLQTSSTPGQLHPAVSLSLVVQVARELWDTPVVELSMDFDGESSVDEGELAILQLVVEPPGAEGAGYRLYVAESARSWRSFAHGTVAALPAGLESDRVASATPISISLRSRPADLDRYPIHPAAMDAIVQALRSEPAGSPSFRYRIGRCARARVRGNLPTQLTVELSKQDTSGEEVSRFDCILRSLDGRIVAEFEGLDVQYLGPVAAEPSSDEFEHVEGRIRELVEQTLGITAGLDDDVGNDYGVDSLSLIAFMAAMQKEFSVSLQQIFRSRSFSVRSLADVVRGGASSEDELEVEFVRAAASTPVEVREGETEVFPAAYGLGYPTKTWFGSVSGEFEFELVEFGQGEPLVFLPPYNSEWPIWLPTMTKMAKGHRVIGVNYPGLGRCRGASELRDVSQLAAWLSWTMDALSLRAATVVGWSLGGFLAQKMARERPDLVARLVLVNTTAKLEASETAAGAGGLVSQLNAHLKEELLSLSSDSRDRITSLVYHGQERRKFEFGYYKALTNWDSREWLSEVRQPTWIVAGIKDPLTPPEHGERLHRLIQGSSYTIIDSGHYVPLFAAEALGAKLEAFCGS